MASLILILVAVGLVAAAAVAGLSHLARPWLVGLLASMPVEQRANLLLVWALLPLLAGLLAVAGVVAPSLLTAAGLMADHCLMHGTHHSHLCLLHPGTTPTVPGAGPLLALLGSGILVGGADKARRLERSTRSWRSLARVASAEPGANVRILEIPRPVAATVGMVRPTVLFSRGLLDRLSAQAGRAVRAHEAAARTLGNRIAVAEALLALARLRPGSEIQAPMAMVILFGLASSTVLNMVVLPALYLRFGAAARTRGEPG